jgi:hypothetical protein
MSLRVAAIALCFVVGSFASAQIPAIPVATPASSSALGSTPYFRLRNLRLAACGISTSPTSDLVAFAVRESDQELDLNGDGDTFDEVLFVYDSATDRLVNVGLATSNCTIDVDAQFVGFVVPEQDQGQTDLNGDGDTLDRVGFVYDSTSATVMNIGVAVANGPLVANGHVLFFASEHDQGNVDLNADGDTLDQVFQDFDIATGVTTNLGIALGSDSLHRAGNLLAFQSTESNQGHVDLDGDGDAADRVPFVYDVSTGIIRNVAIACQGRLVLTSSLLAFVVPESEQGHSDLNGDGDATDDVMHVFDPANGALSNLGLAVGGSPAAGGPLLAFSVPESSQGNTDLDGNGDSVGFVVHVYDQRTGLVTNTRWASGTGLSVSDDFVMFSAQEFSRGVDLDGDGDASDDVVEVYDAVTGTVTNLHVASNSQRFQSDQGRFAFFVEEAVQGGMDLNGDGDGIDGVVHLYDAHSGVLTNTRLAVFSSERIIDLSLEGDIVGFRVSEHAQGNSDSNGDGDLNDRVVCAYDLTSGIATNFRVAATAEPMIGRDLVAFYASEAQQGGRDLNGDGDADDSVAFVARRVHGLACSAGTVNLGAGSVSDVLRIDGSAGSVSVARNAPFTLSLAASPSGPSPARYALWVWSGAGTQSVSLGSPGSALGCLVNPSPNESGQFPQPIRCLRGGISALRACGEIGSIHSPSRAPFALAREHGLPQAVTLTVQGIIEDNGSASPRGFSVTNAVELIVH